MLSSAKLLKVMNAFIWEAPTGVEFSFAKLLKV